MAKNTQPSLFTTKEVSNGFPVPFTAVAFQRDVVVLYVHQMRTMAWFTGGDAPYQNAIWQMAKKSTAHSHNLFFPDDTVEDLGVSWEDVRDTEFAKYVYSMYQYGCLGIQDTSLDGMEDDGTYTWFSTLLFDMKNSAFLEEWSAYGGEGQESARRCYEMAELANARCTLENGQPFSYLVSGNSLSDQGIEDGQLTVRQLALLAAMEEMSIRSAANPGRPNPLPIVESARLEKRTRFDVGVAKIWLEGKGRYISIVQQHKGGDIDLTARRFQNIDDLARIVDDRLNFLSCGNTPRPDLVEKAKLLHEKYCIQDLDRASFQNQDFVRSLAIILQFPPELFALRVREMIARHDLATVERELREAI